MGTGYPDDTPLETEGEARTAATANDVRDMHRMVLPFELQRRFTTATIFGFACILGATWEYAIITSLAALSNGGSGGTTSTTACLRRDRIGCSQ